MTAFGRFELTAIELPDELQFRAVRQYCWIDLIVQASLLIALLWMTLKFQSLWAIAADGFCIAGFVAWWVHGRSTMLRVTNRELVARGNLSGILTAEVRVKASEVTAMGYDAGGAEDPDGLYVKCGRCRTFLLHGLSRQQAQTVVDAISLKFPQIQGPNPGPGSSLPGK